MRACDFHSRNVASCVWTSTRLWTCIRSIRFARRSSIERSIDLIPFPLPRVQTFVARNNLSWMPTAVVNSPITSSACPYIGDVSITRPPSFTKSERTSPSCLRLSPVRSTSNACQVPRPITGSFSPVEGIARVSIASDSAVACPRNASTGKSKPPAVAPISRAASRLVIICILGRLIRSRQLAHPFGTPLYLAQLPLARFLGTPKAFASWHRSLTTAICQYETPPFYQNRHRNCVCSKRRVHNVARRQIREASAHSDSWRHRIHRAIPSALCAESRAQGYYVQPWQKPSGRVAE